jgi:hypothetical protein
MNLILIFVFVSFVIFPYCRVFSLVRDSSLSTVSANGNSRKEAQKAQKKGPRLADKRVHPQVRTSLLISVIPPQSDQIRMRRSLSLSSFELIPGLGLSWLLPMASAAWRRSRQWLVRDRADLQGPRAVKKDNHAGKERQTCEKSRSHAED